MSSNIEFSKDLIKGKIAEIIFEQMFRESGRFTILRSGYEYTWSELAQYQHNFLKKAKEAMKNIRHLPDFILVNQERTEVFIVEVKFQSRLNANKENKIIAEKLLKISDPSHLFVASPKGFYYSPCNKIVYNGGKIEKLSVDLIKKSVQDEYLELLNEFERK